MVSVLAEDVTPTSPEEKDLIARRTAILDWETGYNHEQETRPQTLGVAMADSPVGAAGWILEKFGQWADLPKRADGGPDLWSKFTEEELLTNIMLYVAPSSVVTATWIYHGKRLEGSDRFPPEHACGRRRRRGVSRPRIPADAAVYGREDLRSRSLERHGCGRPLRGHGTTGADVGRLAGVHRHVFGRGRCGRIVSILSSAHPEREGRANDERRFAGAVSSVH